MVIVSQEMLIKEGRVNFFVHSLGPWLFITEGDLSNKKLNPTIASVTLCAGAQTAPATIAG